MRAAERPRSIPTQSVGTRVSREFYLRWNESIENSIRIETRATFTQANPKPTHPTPSAKRSAVCSRSHALRGNANGTLRVPYVQTHPTIYFVFWNYAGLILVCGPQSGRGAFQRRALERGFYLRWSESKENSFTTAMIERGRQYKKDGHDFIVFLFCKLYRDAGSDEIQWFLRFPEIQKSKRNFQCEFAVFL